jgi:hypothetical protein
MDTPAELPPGCLVVLIRLSDGMTADVVTARGEIPAFVAARQLADELVEGLVNASANHALGPLDVAVLGYRTNDEGAPQLYSLLPTGDMTPRFVPLDQVSQLPVETRAGEGQPRKWTVLPPCAGDPCAADALARVYQLVAVWLTGRFAARPPVIVHGTNPDGLDESYLRAARSLGLLATGYGPTRLLHYLFEPGAPPLPVGTWATPREAGRWAELFALSAELPKNADKPERRALATNDWDITDLWSAVFDVTWREDAVAWAGSGAFSHNREMWAQKMGNSPEQWEDAFAVDAEGGVAAIADGASTGIYCNIWADQLSKRFLTDRPDTRDPFSLNKWVNGLRSEWRTAIKYSSLNWSKQAKVDQTGAASTLLALEVGPETAGERPWRVCAVGDATLFWVRGGRLVATFPVVAADQFGSAPLLIRSNPGFKTLALAAAGTCRSGDRFVLATDAVSARLFKNVSVGPGPDWGRYERITQDAWREELDTLRQANDMVNDDCTLVVLRVAGGTDEPEEEIPDALPIDGELAEALAVEDSYGGTEDERLPTVRNKPDQRPEPTAKARTEEDAESADDPRSARPEDFVITADVGDLMLDIPHDPPADDPAERSAPRVEPPPAEEPPAARDGFPESTDTRD